MKLQKLGGTGSVPEEALQTARNKARASVCPATLCSNHKYGTSMDGCSECGRARPIQDMVGNEGKARERKVSLCPAGLCGAHVFRENERACCECGRQGVIDEIKHTAVEASLCPAKLCASHSFENAQCIECGCPASNKSQAPVTPRNVDKVTEKRLQ